MPTPTYTPLANITLGSSAASVTFSSISQAYRDLVLIAHPKDESAYTYSAIRFNGDSASNYPWVRMMGDGSTTSSASGTSTAIGGYAYLSSFTYGMVSIFNIMDYSATDKHKSVLDRESSADTLVTASAHRWANTSAITSITVFAPNNFSAGSSFALYGIAA